MMIIQGTYGDSKLISKLAAYRMPFGKHVDVLLIDLPVAYLNWFSKEGFPQGELGRLMRIVHENKLGGMEYVFDGIRKNYLSNQANPVVN